MRTKFPILAAILGLFLFLIGAGGQWVFKAPVQQAVETQLPDSAKDAQILRIPASAGGTEGFDFTMKGTGPWDVALIRSVDAKAWVANTKEVVLTRNGDELAPQVSGTETQPLDTSSSDIFAKITEQRGETAQHISAAQASQQYDVVVVGKNGSGLPSSFVVNRTVQAPQPWAVPLMLAGGILLLGALLWAFLQRRRTAAAAPVEAADDAPTTQLSTVGAVRSGSHQAPRALAGLLVAGLVAGASLPGMSLPGESSSASSSDDATPTVSGPQLSRIVESVSSVLGKADAEKNKDLLAQRAVGGALTLRTSNYEIRSKNPKASAPAAVSTKIVTSMVPYADSFPRTVVAVVQESPSDLPTALVLEQKDAHSAYLVRETMSMLPGATFPKPADSKVRMLSAEDRGGAVMSGEEVMSALSEYLQDPTGNRKSVFESTAFQTELIDFQKQVRQKTKDATVTFKHTVDLHETRVLPTADGGAMVFGYMSMLYTAAPKQKGELLDLSGTPYEKLVGSSKVDGKISVAYGESVMIYVPKEGSSQKPVVTGVDQDLLSARKG